MRNVTPLMTVLAVAGHWACARAEVMGCLVEPDRVADVGSQSVGVLDRLMVERGDKVAAGQVLARLAASVERASVSVAEARSQADAELRQAMAAHELAQRKLTRTRDLLKQDFVSGQAVDQADAEARVAEQRVVQAREAQRVAQREYQLTAAQLGQRDVRSPFEGVVVERYRTEGERIEREPVVRVARLDPLRVEAIVPAQQFGSISAGQLATVKTELPGFGALAARVTLVDRVIDPASNSFRVRLTIPNPESRIPSGLRCKVEFGGQAAGPAQPVPSATAPAAPPRSAAVPGPRPARAGALPVDPLNPLNPPAALRPARAVMPGAQQPSALPPATPPVRTPSAAPLPAAPMPSAMPPRASQAPAALPARQPLPQAAPTRLAPPVRQAASSLSTAEVPVAAVRVTTQAAAPERQLVKQYIMSREPRLAMDLRIGASRLAALKADRPLLTLASLY